MNIPCSEARCQARVDPLVWEEQAGLCDRHFAQACVWAAANRKRNIVAASFHRLYGQGSARSRDVVVDELGRERSRGEYLAQLYGRKPSASY